MKTLHALIRVSTTKQVEKGWSPDTQREFATLFAKAKGFDHIEWYDETADNKGSSATKDSFAHMPEFTRLINNINAKNVTDMYAYDISRTSRSNALSRAIFDACSTNKTILHTDKSSFDFSNPDHELLFDLQTAISKNQALRTKIASKMGIKRAVESGRVVGSAVPYGYCYEHPEKQREKGVMVIHPEEAEIVKKIFSNKISGWSDQRICDWLNEAKIATKHGALMFRDQTIRHILYNPIYVGKRRTINGILDFPELRIIDDDTFNRIDEVYKNNRAYTYTPTKHQHLLKGLVFCGTCGLQMYGVSKEKKNHHVYMCLSKRKGYTNCGCKNPNLFKLNDLAWQVVSTHLNNIFLRKSKLEELLYKYDPEIQKTLYNSADFMKKTQKEIVEIDKKLDKLAWLFVNGQYNQEQLKSMEGELRTEKTSLEKKLATLTDHEQIDILADRIALIHEELLAIHNKIGFADLQMKSTMIKKMIEKITVYWDDPKHEIELKFRINSTTVHPEGDSVFLQLPNNDIGSCGSLVGVIYTYKSKNFEPAEMTDIQLY